MISRYTKNCLHYSNLKHVLVYHHSLFLCVFDTCVSVSMCVCVEAREQLWEVDCPSTAVHLSSGALVIKWFSH